MKVIALLGSSEHHWPINNYSTLRCAGAQCRGYSSRYICSLPPGPRVNQTSMQKSDICALFVAQPFKMVGQGVGVEQKFYRFKKGNVKCELESEELKARVVLERQPVLGRRPMPPGHLQGQIMPTGSWNNGATALHTAPRLRLLPLGTLLKVIATS